MESVQQLLALAA
jgi:hypothetical protein